MATLAQIRAAIKTTLEGVAGIGQVHDYERFAKSRDTFRSFYLDGATGQIRGWFIRWVGQRVTSPAAGRYVVVNRWQIRGYMSLDDSAGTEKTFNDLVEAAVLAFRADETLGGVVDSIVVGDTAGPQVEDAGPVDLAGVLCHGGRLALATRHCE